METSPKPHDPQNPPPPPSLPSPSSSIPRSDSQPSPTTFVQADTSSFKQVVQFLTGSSNSSSSSSSSSNPKKHSFKLYERRNSLNNNNNNNNNHLFINTFNTNNNNINTNSSSRKPDILSPSLLDFPSLSLSPVTPLTPQDVEEKAIAEKGFYLHPSPLATPRDSQPQLLPLFPVTSPPLSDSDESPS